MELNSTNLTSMRTAFNLRFKAGIEAYKPIYADLAMIEGDVAHDAIEFPFLEQFAGMREWLGDRQYKSLSSNKITIKEKPFEQSVSIPRRKIETDNWGIYGTVIAQMGAAGEQLWDELFIEALANPAAWFDGKAFYVNNRKYGSAKNAGTINNIATLALDFANFGTFYLQMSTLTGATGKPLSSRPTHLIVGPALEDTARIILTQDKYKDAQGNEVLNPHKGKCQLVVHPLLVGDYANDWYLGKFDAVLKPIMIMKNKIGALVSLTSETDENVFQRDEVVYGNSAYGNAAALFPHLLGRSRPSEG